MGWQRKQFDKGDRFQRKQRQKEQKQQQHFEEELQKRYDEREQADDRRKAS